MASNVDRGYAWVVLAASFAVDMVIGILLTSLGILTTAIVDEIDDDITRASLVSSTFWGTSTLFGPLAGVIQDRIGHRLTGITSGLLMLAGLTAASFCKTVSLLVSTFGVLAGIGAGLAINLSGVAPGSYFVKKLPLAYGIIQAGGGSGLFIVGPLMVFLLESYNLHGTLLILGGIGFQVTLAGALIRPNTIADTQEQDVTAPAGRVQAGCQTAGVTTTNKVTEREGQTMTNPAGDASTEVGVPLECLKAGFDPRSAVVIDLGVEKRRMSEQKDKIGRNKQESSIETTTLDPLIGDHPPINDTIGVHLQNNLIVKIVRHGLSVLGSNGFFLFLLSGFFWSMGESSCMVHLPNYVESKGSTPTQTASLLTAMGIASIISSVLSGFAASDPNIGNILLSFGSMGVSGMLSLLFPLYSNRYSLQMIYSTLYGIYSQAIYTLVGPICIELVGLSNLAFAYGLSAFSLGLGYLIGPPVSSCCIIVGSFFVALVPMFKTLTCTRK